MPAVIQVAVASSSGQAIDLHFGHAKCFYIYRLGPDGAQLLELRQVEHYCHGGHGAAGALHTILDTIADCTAVFVARIGDGPTEKLAARGIRAVSDYPWSTIDEALHHWWQRNPV